MFHKSPTGLRTFLFQITCFVVLYLCTIPMMSCLKKKYFSLEHPKIMSINSEYLANVVFKSRQKSRSNPIHYVDFNCTVLKTFNNNIKFTIAFYQLLSNVYKPSFVEYTMRVCDLIKKDVLIAAAFIEGFNRMPPDTRPIPELACPVTPGNYSFTDMVIPLKNIPAGFPFGDGRLYVNVTRFNIILRQNFSLEQPKVTFAHPLYFSNVHLKSRRKSRLNPIHYVDMNGTLLKTLDNSSKVSASFYQLLSNVYKRSFVELMMPLCDALRKDLFIAPAFIAGFNRMPPDSRPIPELKCPLTPGNYSFTNMMIPTATIPAGLPFLEGRLYGNMTQSNVVIGSIQIDFQLITTNVK